MRRDGVLEQIDLAISKFLGEKVVFAFETLMQAKLVRDIVKANVHMVPDGLLHVKEGLVSILMCRAAGCHILGSVEQFGVRTSLGL
jgi:hypothetical protein